MESPHGLYTREPFSVIKVQRNFRESYEALLQPVINGGKLGTWPSLSVFLWALGVLV